MTVEPDAVAEQRRRPSQPAPAGSDHPSRQLTQRKKAAGAAVAAGAVLVAAAVLLRSGGPETVLVESFDGPPGAFATQDSLWSKTVERGDDGASESQDEPAAEQPDDGTDSDWLAESGTVEQREGLGWTESEIMRIWTSRTDLTFADVSMDVRFDGWVNGAEQDWHGINLWLNTLLCTPAPGCSAIADDGGGGPSGYALDFMNRNGDIAISKKVAGDTRDRWPAQAGSYTNGGTYYTLAQTEWEPEVGRTYRLSGRALDEGDGRVALVISVDGEALLRVVDDGGTGGPVLTGGRVGLRSDYARMRIDDLRVAQ